jgi:hypothetical protein
MQYGASQGYGPGPGGQQNPQANNMGPGQYQGRPMPNHVPQFPYQVCAIVDVICLPVVVIFQVNSCIMQHIHVMGCSPCFSLPMTLLLPKI